MSEGRGNTARPIPAAWNILLCFFSATEPKHLIYLSDPVLLIPLLGTFEGKNDKMCRLHQRRPHCVILGDETQSIGARGTMMQGGGVVLYTRAQRE